MGEARHGRLYMIPLIKSSKTGRAIFSFGEDEEGNCERARKVLLRWLFSVLVQKYLPHDNLLSCIFAVYAPLYVWFFFFPWCTWWNKEKSEHDKDCHQNHSYLTLHGGVPARTVGQEQRRKTRGPEREAESLLTDTMVTKQWVLNRKKPKAKQNQLKQIR